MDPLQLTLLLSIIIGSLVLFVSDKMPIDGVAFLVLVALLLTGLVDEDLILTGFSNPATITIAAMFVLSAGLERTGVVRWLTYKLQGLVGKTNSAARMGIVMGSATGFFSAFINNTATVGVLLPVTMRLCRERGISPTKVLMTLSFAAQFGGVCTLIGTTTNLLVNAYAVGVGLPSFSLFEFAKLGMICFAVGMVYMTFAIFFLPERAQADDANATYNLKDYVTEVRVLKDSPLIGQTGGENHLLELSDDIHLLEIVRGGQTIWSVQATAIKEADILLVRGSVDRVMEAVGRLKLDDWADTKLADSHLESDDISLVEVILPRGSHLIGKTLTQLDFYWRYHAAVLAMKRHNEVISKRLSDVVFHQGDMLLLQGHMDDLNILASDKNFMVLNDLSSMRLKKKRAIVAVLLMVLFITLVATGTLSVLGAALVVAAAVVLTQCLTMREAYDAVNWPIFLLIAGLLPLGIAMQTTGAAVAFADYILNIVGDHGPTAALAGIYAITMLLTAMMSNTATAAILAPLSLGVAHSFGVSPIPFLVAVAFAASTCFTTPVGYQTNMMVYGPGGYKYVDFLKIGLPLNFIIMGVSVYFIPLFWPF